MSIFDYFFDVLNSSLSEPMYIRDDVEEGDIFDEDKYDYLVKLREGEKGRANFFPLYRA